MFTVVSQRSRQNKVAQQFVKPLIVILFVTHPVTRSFGDDIRFRTTTELSLYNHVTHMTSKRSDYLFIDEWDFWKM